MRRHLIVIVAVVTVVGIAPAASAHASAAHWCRQGDPPVLASASTNCALAGNIVTDYVNVCHQSRACHMRASSSPPKGKRYGISCRRIGGRYTGTIACIGPAGSGISARFSSDI